MSGIVIISGEGTGGGTVEVFEDTGSDSDIRERLIKERCGGDRWARALVNVSPGVWVDFETGECRTAPRVDYTQLLV